MKRTRRKCDVKFKAKVAIGALKERETLNELATKYELSPVMISRWKKEFIENSAAAFETSKAGDAALEKQKDRYLRKIGDLEMQPDLPSVSIVIARQSANKFVHCARWHDWLPSGSRQLGIEMPADD